MCVQGHKKCVLPVALVCRQCVVSPIDGSTSLVVAKPVCLENWSVPFERRAQNAFKRLSSVSVSKSLWSSLV